MGEYDQWHDEQTVPNGSFHLVDSLGNEYWIINAARVALHYRLTLTDVAYDGGEVPGAFTLSQNYPSPFNPTTVVRFQLPVVSDVRLAVFDVLGREVSVLVNGRMNAGVHEVKFDRANLASGLYFYRLQEDVPNIVSNQLRCSA